MLQDRGIGDQRVSQAHRSVCSINGVERAGGVQPYLVRLQESPLNVPALQYEGGTQQGMRSWLLERDMSITAFRLDAFYN